MAAVEVLALRLPFTRAYALRGEQVVLVDTGAPGHGPAIMAQLKRFGISTQQVTLIVITHGHRDHYGGLVELKEHLSAPVAVHALDARALPEGANPWTIPTSPLGRVLALAARGMAQIPNPARCADLLLSSPLELEPYGVDARVLHTPGHTPGSLTVLTHDGDALCGDLLMSRGLATGPPALPLFASEVAQVHASVRLLLSAGAQRFHIAHGGPFSASAVARLAARWAA